MKKQKGSSIITTPIIIAIGIILISILIVTIVKIIMPYIWYEKLSSTCIKYVYVIEEYGYLTKKEAKMLEQELKKQGFNEEKLKIEYTSQKVNYGDEIYLKINYEYEFELPIAGKQEIPMQIEKYSVCKR
jgi:hypothetical protein